MVVYLEIIYIYITLRYSLTAAGLGPGGGGGGALGGAGGSRWFSMSALPYTFDCILLTEICRPAGKGGGAASSSSCS